MGLTPSDYVELSENFSEKSQNAKFWPPVTTPDRAGFFFGKFQFWMVAQIFNLLRNRRKFVCILFWGAFYESEIREILKIFFVMFSGKHLTFFDIWKFSRILFESMTNAKWF